MDLAQLRTFVAAAEAGSFVAAGNAVYASSSSVTERIAALEQRIGARLFLRSRKGCQLTEAGERFLPRARAMLASWEIARDEVALPARFVQQVRIGAQYALWPELLLPWIRALRARRADHAFHLTAGASTRMNASVAAGIVDLAVLYSPVLGAGISAREVLNDQLVLVCATKSGDWRDAWVDIDWGETMRGPIAEATGFLESDGLTLDLGGLAVRWLIENGGAGYVPERLAAAGLAAGHLRRIEECPAFDFPAFAIWRSDCRFDAPDLVDDLTAFVQDADLLTGPSGA